MFLIYNKLTNFIIFDKKAERQNSSRPELQFAGNGALQRGVQGHHPEGVQGADADPAEDDPAYPGRTRCGGDGPDRVGEDGLLPAAAVWAAQVQVRQGGGAGSCPLTHQGAGPPDP